MASPKFLIVNEQTYIRDMIKKVLLNHFPNCLIADANRANKGLAFMSMNRFDIVISDRCLPDADIIEFYNKAHGKSTSKKTAFIGLLEEESKKEVEQMEEAGISNSLTMPISGENMMKTVVSILEAKDKLPRDYRELPPGVEVSGLSALSYGKGANLKKGPKPLARATLIFNKVSTNALVTAATLRDITCLCNVHEFYPSILEDVHITLYELKGEYITEIDTFVDEVALPAPKRETGAIKVRLVIDDQRSDRVAELSNLIAG